MQKQRNIGFEELFRQVTQLDIENKIKLLDGLYFSIDNQNIDLNHIDKLWSDEVESRIDAYKTGEIKSISANQVFSKLISD
jgi:putative addiction module component (TIGR02574 family)